MCPGRRLACLSYSPARCIVHMNDESAVVQHASIAGCPLAARSSVPPPARASHLLPLRVYNPLLRALNDSPGRAMASLVAILDLKGKVCEDSCVPFLVR